MDDLLYLIVIICLTIFMVFFGGHNNQDKIEYDSDYFNNLNFIIKFEKKINLIYLNNNNDIFSNTNFVNIDKYFNTTNILLPNYVNCFLIKINPNSIFNIYNIIDKSKCKTHIMVIFNHNSDNNLELVIGNLDNLNNLDNDEYCDFYDLKKNISTTGIYPIYNNSNVNVVITCFILKKPFWHK